MVHTLLPPLTAILQIPTMQQFDLPISATKVRQKVEHLQHPFAFSVIGVLIPWIGVIISGVCARTRSATSGWRHSVSSTSTVSTQTRPSRSSQRPVLNSSEMVRFSIGGCAKSMPTLSVVPIVSAPPYCRTKRVPPDAPCGRT